MSIEDLSSLGGIFLMEKTKHQMPNRHKNKPISMKRLNKKNNLQPWPGGSVVHLWIGFTHS